MIFHRYLYVVAASGLPVLAFAGINQVPVASTLQARDAKPGFPYDENTTSYCSFWYDNDGSMSFQDVISVFGVPLDKFLRWVCSLNTYFVKPCGIEHRATMELALTLFRIHPLLRVVATF